MLPARHAPKQRHTLNTELLRILILEGAEEFDDLGAGGGGVHVHLLPDFVEFHNVQHLETNAIDE